MVPLLARPTRDRGRGTRGVGIVPLPCAMMPLHGADGAA